MSTSGGQEVDGSYNWDPRDIWGFPNIRGTFLGVPIIRTIVFWGPYWAPPIEGNCHIGAIIGVDMSSSLESFKGYIGRSSWRVL